MHTELDHLVIVADTLSQGVAWCEATLGVAPAAGGRHALMGTHNRLLKLSVPRTASGTDTSVSTNQTATPFAQCYLEIIAIDPDVPPPGRTRWFGMDDPAQQAAVRKAPRLVHAVLRTRHLDMHRWGLVNAGVQPGLPVAAERQTAAGWLRWRILLRDDGATPCPTLIEWQGAHPCDAMPDAAVALQALRLGGLSATVAAVLRPRGVALGLHGPALSATLATPLGPVTLATP